MKSHSTILVCFAVNTEARLFQTRAASNDNIQILLTGIGAENAASSVRSAIEEWKPKAVISSGFAGALNPDLAVGTVLFDCEPETGFLSALSLSEGQPAKFCNVNRVLVSATEKLKLWKERNVDAVDMESYAICKVCREFHVPSGTVRVISDAADEDLPLDFNNLMTSDLRMNYLKLALSILKSPHTLPRLLRFRRALRQASENLAALLHEVLSQVPENSVQTVKSRRSI